MQVLDAMQDVARLISSAHVNHRRTLVVSPERFEAVGEYLAATELDAGVTTPSLRSNPSVHGATAYIFCDECVLSGSRLA